MSDVTTRHPDYESSLCKWKKAADAAGGEDAVKAQKETYLPKPNATDTSAQNLVRYEQYLCRAVYYNATGRTLQGLIGLAFKNAPEIELPAAIELAHEDLSGSGLTLEQHSQATLAEVLKTGRAGLLCDYPPTPAPISKAHEATGEIRPTVSFYPATAIINWRTMQRAGKTLLSMVVLAETYELIDGFAAERKTQYRVLKLAPTYLVEIWREKEKPSTSARSEWEIAETFTPLRGDGSPWSELPFYFVGAQNNDWNIDAGPLYDIAVLNLAHYRNSADYEDSVYITGQPQFWMAGLTEEWRKHLEDKGIYVGARTPILLPVNGSCGMEQAQPNTLAKEAMDAKEQQMAALGARLIMEGSAVKTATQQDSEDAVAHSVLSLACDNVSAAYTMALEAFGIFAKVEGEVLFELSDEYTSTTLDAPMLKAMLEAVQAGRLPESEFWRRLREAGVIDPKKTDDELREEISAQNPNPAGEDLLDEEVPEPVT